MATAEQRDAAQTRKVAAGALNAAKGNRKTAARVLRGQAAQAAGDAQAALEQGAGDERTQQLLDKARRRLRGGGRGFDSLFLRQ